ncbi:MAG: carbohydrate kinase [Flavitalea sp.]
MPTKHKIVCFGEVLWDVLPNGARPGGAPVNVAYHLMKHGIDVSVITRIGNDASGTELREIFSTKGIDTSLFQVDNKYETSRVLARIMDNHEVEYDIVRPVAWDHIEWKDEFVPLLVNTDWFIFGSLASREPASRETLYRLLDQRCSKVFDVNLRKNCFTRELIEDLLPHADFVKMNEAELELISGWHRSLDSIPDQLQFVSDKYQVSDLVVTCGADGAVLFSDGKIYKQPGIKVNVADTVGSGDAFLAGLLSRLLNGETKIKALNYANSLGAFVAGKDGACPEYDAPL